MADGRVSARLRPESGAFDLALRLTLLALLLRPIGSIEILAAGMLGLAAAGLLFRPLRESSLSWLALAAMAAFEVASDWPLPDNHAYLRVYWFVAVALALSDEAPEVRLAWNGRMLVGLVLALATLWKLASPEFRDGTFFGVTLVSDPRFFDLARLVGDLPRDVLAAAGEALDAHVDGPADTGGIPEVWNARLRAFAWIATWATLGVEGAVALAFLWPLGRGPSRFRDGALLLFCATTYAVATVEGFAWLLLAMGAAQAAGRGWRRAYVGVFFLVLFYREVAWLGWLADRIGSGA